MENRITITKTEQHSVHFTFENHKFVLNRWGVIVVDNGTPGKPFYQYQGTFDVEAEKEITNRFKVNQTWPKRYTNPMYWYK